MKYIVEGLWKLFKVDLPLPHSCCLQDIELLTAAFNNHSTFDAAFLAFFFFFSYLNIAVEDFEGTF